MKYLINLLFITLVSFNSYAERESGGGYLIKCSQSDLLTLDFYQATMLEWGEIKPNKSENFNTTLNGLRNVNIENLFLHFLKQHKKIINSSLFSSFNEMKFSSKKVGKFISHFNRSHRTIPNIAKWEIVDKDKLEEDLDTNVLLPSISENCHIFQAVKSYAEGNVQILAGVKENLDSAQKKILQLHEKTYHTGYTKYAHSNSFLTRNLISTFLKSLKYEKNKFRVVVSLKGLIDIHRFLESMESYKAFGYNKYKIQGNYSRYDHLPPLISPLSFYGEYRISNNSERKNLVEGSYKSQVPDEISCPLKFKIQKPINSDSEITTDLYINDNFFMGVQKSFFYPPWLSIKETPYYWGYDYEGFSLVLSHEKSGYDFDFKITRLNGKAIVLEVVSSFNRDNTNFPLSRKKVESCLYTAE